MSTRAQSILSRQPKLVLCEYDTPVQRLHRLEVSLGVRRLYIKRDDLNGIGPGGNKVRALEYLLAHAKANRANVVIASGQKNSNLCTLAAAACCKLGLRCILVHNNEEPKHQEGNMILNQLLGVERIYIGDKSESERTRFVKKLAREVQCAGEVPFVIENGATTPLGLIGYAHLPLELSRHAAGTEIKRLFVPGGNGGLAAGVLLGNMLLGHPFHVHVITVEHTVEELRGILDDLLVGAVRMLNIEELPSPEASTIHGEYRGEGWAVSTEESDAAIYTLAQLEGIFLEKIYTSKTFWGMYDLVRKNNYEGSCLIHSGGFGSLFSQFA